MRHRKTACFGALVLEPHSHFDQILRPLLATLLSPFLGWQSSLQASSYLKMQSVKLPLYQSPAGCI